MVWWRCEKGHEWETLISTRAGGSKCPFCSGIKLLKDIEDKDQTVTITPPPDIPKTGDTTNTPLWGALTGISLLGAGVVAFFTFRKKKEENGHER